MAVGFRVASAFVQIKADDAGLRQDVQAKIKKATSGTNKVKITANLDATQVKTQLKNLAKNQMLKLKINLDATKAKADIKALGKNITVKVKVELDTKDAEARLASLGHSRSVSLQADVDTARATTQIAFLTRMRDMNIQVNVNNSSINNVTNSLNGVTSSAGRSSRAMRLLKLAILGLTVAPGVFGVAASAIKTLVTASAIAVPAVLALGAAFATIKMGFSGIGSAISAGRKSAAPTDNSAAISSARQVADAKRSLSRAQRDLQYTEEDSAKSIAAAEKQVADAQQGLRDTEVQAAEDRAEAAEHVKDAQNDLARTYEDVARANAQAVRQVQDAEKSLASAQEKAKQAQLDLTKARKDAAEQLLDLNNQLKDAQLDQRDAILDLKDAQEALDRTKVSTDPVAAANAYTRALQDQKDAQDALNAVRAKGDQASAMETAQAETAFANASARAADAAEDLAKAQSGQTTPEDIDRAQLAYDRAKQALSEQTTETSRLSAQTTEANKAGVEGSDTVKDAKDSLKSANDSVVDSVQSLQDAEQSQAQAAEDGANRVADAQEAVSDAVRSQQQTFRESAKAIADSQQQIIDAQNGVRDAHEQAARDMLSANEDVEDSARNLSEAYQDAGKSGVSAADDFDDAMKKLSPNARSFVQAVLDISPAWKKVKLSIQDALFNGWDTKLKEMSSATLPAVKQGLTGMADVLNKMGNGVFDSLTKMGKDGTLTKLFSGLNDAMKPLEKTPGKLTTAFAQIGIAASPALKKFTTWLAGRVDDWTDKINRTFKSGKLEDNISGAAKRIGDAIKSIKENPQLNAFLKAMKDQGPATGKALKDMAKAILVLSTSLGYGIGAALFKLAEAASKLVLALPQWFIEALLIFASTLSTLMKITAIVTAVRAWAIAQYALNGAFLLSPMTWVLIGIAALITVIVIIATKTTWFQTAWMVCWAAIKLAFDVVWNWIKTNWPLLVEILTGPIGIVVVQMIQHWDAIKKAISDAWNWIKVNVFTNIQQFFTKTIPGWLTTVRDFFSNTWTTISNKTKQIIADWIAWGVNKFTSFKTSVANVLNSVKNTFNSIVTTVKNLWNAGWVWMTSKWTSFSNSLKSGFSSFGSSIRNSLTSTVNGLKSIWDRLEGYFKTPIKFLINTVINGGVVKGVNWVLGKIGVSSKIPNIPMPSGFAKGGPVRGRGTKTSDSIPAMLSNGEHVLTADDVKAMGGHSAVMAMRKPGARKNAKRGSDGMVHASLGGIIGDTFSSFIKDPLGSVAKGGKWLWDAGTSWTRDAAAKLVGMGYDKIVDPVLRNIPLNGASASIVKGVPPYLKDKVTDFIKGKGDAKQKAAESAGLGSYKPGAGVAQWAGVVRQSLSMVHQSQGLVNTTLRRMNQESGGNPKAINLWDSNASQGYDMASKGLMQVIGPTFRANAGSLTGRGIWDPLANVYSSMRYALGRYGSLSSAYNRAGGYAKGGLAKGWSVVGEKGPELINAGSGSRVLTNSQSQAALGGGSSLTIGTLTVNVDSKVDITDPTDRKKFATSMVKDIKEAIRKDDLSRGR